MFYFLDNEGNYKESLQAIVDQLKDEYQMEMDKIDDQYNQIVKEAKKKFKLTGLKTNGGIQLLEEKFRLDMYNSIVNVINPRTSKFSIENNSNSNGINEGNSSTSNNNP